jgi:hypothetical protein
MGRRPATREEQQKKKLQDATTYLKDAGWRSTNDFILDHYNAPTLASQSLRLQRSKSYAPDDIMAAWLANVPSGSKKELHLSITRHAAQIMVNEKIKTEYSRLSGCISNAAWEGRDSV